MYDILNINEDKPTAQQTWNDLYNIQEKDWKKIYMYPMKITKYCTLQWFQICINHNILITNKRLQYMGIKDDPLCTFCKTHVETTVHLLWNCSITKDFFKSFLSWLRSFHIHIELSEKLFLFGLESGEKVSNVSKFILLYAKYYIYCSRCNNHSLMLEIFKKKLYFMYKIHMEIAYANNNLDKFQNEWRPYEDLLKDINTY